MNGLGIVALVAVSFFFAGPFALLAGAIAEAAYLLVVPHSSWYTRRLSSKFDDEITKRRDKLKKQIFPHVRPEVQTRFNELEAARKAMTDQIPEDQSWFLEVLRKLDYLLDKFLQFADKEAEFRKYLRTVLDDTLREKQNAAMSTLAKSAYVKSQSSKVRWQVEPPLDPAERWVGAVVTEVQGHYDTEMADLDQQRTRDTEDITTNAVLDKRVDIIRRRRDYVGQIGKITVNLNHQMELMEDTFGLISDELRARTPEQILADIDEVIGRTDALTEALQDFSPATSTTAASEELQVKA
jgi:hypothetical protein